MIARYRQTVSRVGLNVGVNLGAQSDVRVGAYVGRTTASITVGNPGFPELTGKETGAEIVWRVTRRTVPVVPSRGLLSEVRLSRIFNGPDVDATRRARRFRHRRRRSCRRTANRFWSVGPRNRVFLYGGFGTSFDDVPLPTDQFALGMPFRLGAYNAGELSGTELLRRDRRLPAAGRPAAGLHGRTESSREAGSKTATRSTNGRVATWRTNGGVGVVMDTLVGPVVVAGSWGFDGRWRTYLAVGRTFR